MSLPTDPSRLEAITGYLQWRRAVERLLKTYDQRIAGVRRNGIGEFVLMPGAVGLPAGMLLADGTVYNRADHPELFDFIGTTYNTGGETGTQFRVPTVTSGTPANHVWAIRG